MSETTQPAQLKRKLGARHLNMIAIGGSIGTGLFLASGATIANAGPGGALLAYCLIGVMIYFLMTSLGELATHNPTSGAFFTYGTKYVEGGFGFALGWNYWYNWAITVAFELVAVQFIMKFWFPDIPGFYWSALFLAVSTFANWTKGEAPFVGGLSALIGVAMIAGFSFQGTEMVGVAAGESKDPQKTIPIAIKQIFWRILLFYIVCIFIIGTLISYDDPLLLQAASSENIALSPFTLLYEKAGFAFAASAMNAVILTAILSAGNSGMYTSTRMLFNMAQNGSAPKLFGKLDPRGVPMNALYATTVIAALCFLTTFIGEEQVFNWLLNMSGMCGFIVWLGIAVSHYRFRKGYIAQGHKIEDLAYRAKFFPFAPWFAFILCSIVVLGQNYQAVLAGEWLSVLSTYIGIFLFLVIWLGYKWKYKTKLISYKEMDVNPMNPDRE